ncbi:hypothetical protein [Caulobacter sp. FWC2]|nr:hypothetical protein [Caulobacter sp. FWC2]
MFEDNQNPAPREAADADPCNAPSCKCGPNCRCGDACVCTPATNCAD